MAEKSQQAFQDTIEPMETPPSSPEYSEKDVPLVVKLAHENDFHIHLGWRSWTVLFLASFTLMGQVFVISAAGSVIAFIIRDLGEPEIAGWIIQGPLLMQSILSPTVGRLSDILDRKYMASIPPLVAFVGAIISAKASNMSMLIGGGILIGVTLPTASIIHAIGAEVLPLKYRAVANGLAFLAASLGSVASGLGSGALTNRSSDGWRGIFWIQAGFHGLTSLGFLFLYWPEAHPDYPKMTFKQLFWKCDPIGSFFFMGACALLLLGLNWAGGKFAWSDPHVAATVGVGLFLLVCFCLYEWKGRTDGLVDHIFFQYGPNFPIGVLGFTVEGWIWYSAVNSITPQQILHLGFEPNAWRISIRHLAYNFCGLSMSMAITAWATKKKDLQRPLLLTFILCFIGVICYSTLQPGPQMSKAQYFYSVIMAMGQAGPLTLLVPLVQFTAPHAYLASASGLAYSGRAIGGAFGSAVLDVIINNHLHKHLDSAIGSAAIEAGLPESSVSKLVKAMDSGKTNLINGVPGIDSTILRAARDASQRTHARAYNLAWWSILPFIVICFVGLCFLRGVKELMTEKVEATVENVAKVKEGEKA